MKRLVALSIAFWLIYFSGKGQTINFASEYDKISWPVNLGVGGGLTGDDNSYKRLALYHGHSISLQTGLNTPGLINSRLYIDALGSTGIGTTSPYARLHVSGGSLIIGSRTFSSNTDGHLILGDLMTNSSPTTQDWGSRTTMILNALDYSTIGFHDSGNRVDFIRAGNGVIQLGYDGGWGQATIGLPNGVWNSVGNVGIGTTNPGTYKLAVEGKIGAREVEVKVGSWADFVFQPGYSLRPLSEVASYVSTYHHLPEIPSEADVKSNGIGLGEMNAKLLQKIEELTLYLIDQQKRIELLEIKVESDRKLDSTTRP